MHFAGVAVTIASYFVSTNDETYGPQFVVACVGASLIFIGMILMVWYGRKIDWLDVTPNDLDVQEELLDEQNIEQAKEVRNQKLEFRTHEQKSKSEPLTVDR